MSGMPSADFWLNLGKYRQEQKMLQDQQNAGADMLQMLARGNGTQAPPVAAVPQARPLPAALPTSQPVPAPTMPSIPNRSPGVPPVPTNALPAAMNLSAPQPPPMAPSVPTPAPANGLPGMELLNSPIVRAQMQIESNPMLHLTQMAKMFYARHGGNPPVGEQAAFMSNLMNLFQHSPRTKGIIASLLPSILANQRQVYKDQQANQRTLYTQQQMNDRTTATNKSREKIGAGHDAAKVQAAKLQQTQKNSLNEIRSMKSLLPTIQDEIQQQLLIKNDFTRPPAEQAKATEKIQKLLNLKEDVNNKITALYSTLGPGYAPQ